MSDNQLRHETSPYLLQHADNPVHWRAWNPAALEESQRLDRPILLSIGYAACHWCHVMAHESFEDPDTAAVMNALFVNIKVDREERPDIDQIYMAALHAIGEQGGWPLTMFLTPTGLPIWGGTYFPKVPRYGRPGFVDVLRNVAKLYAEERGNLDGQARRIAEHLSAPRQLPGGELDRGVLDQAADALLGIMDRERGGTKGAPKFPNAPVLDFLARSAERTGRADLAEIVQVTLRGLADGGLFDHVGGGFARYSTDADWLVPHFEKMLSDNGQLLERFTLATDPNHPEPFRERIESTIDWLVREMRLGSGLFAASLDADSDGAEGKFYVWTPAELSEALPENDAGFIASLYDIRPGGNWDGVSIPNRLHPHPPLQPREDERRRHLMERLRRYRDHRPRPALDDKQLADWNGYAIAGIAAAALRFGRSDWLQLAEAAFEAGETILIRDGRLAHSHRAGKWASPGFSSDLAAMARAAIALHQASQQRRYLDRAAAFLEILERHHGDGEGGYHFTADDADALFLRRIDRNDEATPNPHGVAVDALVRLWSLTGEDRFRRQADAILAAASGAMRANVFGSASLLSALDLRLRVLSIVLVAPEGGNADTLREVVAAKWRSNWTLDIRTDAEPLPVSHPAHGKTSVEGRAAAYLCREGSCSLPIVEAGELAAALEP